MSADPDDPGGQLPGRRGFWPEWLTPRRVFEFVRNVVRLERLVETLKADKLELERKLAGLQRQLDEQTGQQKILLTFIGKALDQQVKARAEEAARKVFEMLVTKDSPDKAAKSPRRPRGTEGK